MAKRPTPPTILRRVATAREHQATALADIDPRYAGILRRSAAALREVADRGRTTI